MEPLSLDEFAAVLGGQLLVGQLVGAEVTASCTVDGVATHSSRIRPGSAYFALAGSRVDGHDFVEVAARNGAAIAVVRRGAPQLGAQPDPDAAGLPLVVVDDPLRALQDLATWWRDRLEGRVVAVVGSNGKTITKDCLVQILGFDGSVYGTPGSYNSQLGVPLAILGCPADVEFAVIEVAVSDPGEMAHHLRMVRPDHVVVTNVGMRWRNRFGDRNHQISELVSMGAGMGAGGWLLLGQDDEDLVSAAQSVGPTFVQHRSDGLPTYGLAAHEPGEAPLEITFPTGERATANLHTPSDDILADLELAMSAAHLLGITAEQIRAALQDYTPTATRMEMWRSPSGVTLVRDVATPDPIAVGSAVRAARSLARHGGRTAVVLAEPTDAWEDDAATGLAKALDVEGADDVYAVSSASHRRTAATLQQVASATTMTLFDDAGALRLHLLDHLRNGDVCLVQSPPSRVIGDLASLVMESMAPTRLYVDLSAVDDNVATFRRMLGPAVQIMAMVKALAYGTDAVSISTALQDSGVDFLGVSGADEGVALRLAGIRLPILVLLGTTGELEKMVEYRLTPLVYSSQMLDAVKALAASRSTPLGIHLEVETGFVRAGLEPADALQAIRDLRSLPGIRIEGLMTHLSCADDPDDDDYTFRQLDRFDAFLGEAARLGVTDVIRHAAATSAAIRVPRARLDMVRLGLGLYGLHPSDATSQEVDLEPAIGLVSRLVQIKDAPAGERVGYGGTYTVPTGGERIGLVPAGYADCMPLAFSNAGHVTIAGQRCPIRGRISMDSMAVGLSGCPDAEVGADVLVYGRRGDANVALEEISRDIGSIPYELMVRVGSRVQRIFTRH